MPNFFCVQSHLPTEEDGSSPSSSDWTVSVVLPFLASLPALSLAWLLSAAVFATCCNEGGEEEEGPIGWGAGTGMFNLPSILRFPTDFLLPLPYEAGPFPSFSDVKLFQPRHLPPLPLTRFFGIFQPPPFPLTHFPSKRPAPRKSWHDPLCYFPKLLHHDLLASAFVLYWVEVGQRYPASFCSSSPVTFGSSLFCTTASLQRAHFFSGTQR